jgi:aryl-alcohol dehydrogenase-like predicted oxidoreductase
MMTIRPLGRSPLAIAPLVFGGNVFGWTADPATSFRLLDAFVDAGFNAIDTAEAYSSWVPGHVGGESEAVIGDWLAHSGKRDRVVIATKSGWHSGDTTGLLTAAKITAAVEGSLRRLRVERIDLYQAHSDDAATPLEETLGAYGRLIEQGKVAAIGASNFTAARLREALAVSARAGLPRFESLQPKYNLYDRAEFEAELGPLCVAENVGVISYYALAAGFLTGKYRSEADLGKSPRGKGLAFRLNPRGMRILDALETVASGLGATPAQVALAWVMGRPGVTAPIVSASRVEQWEELAGAAGLVLGDEALGMLETASGA